MSYMSRILLSLVFVSFSLVCFASAPNYRTPVRNFSLVTLPSSCSKDFHWHIYIDKHLTAFDRKAKKEAFKALESTISEAERTLTFTDVFELIILDRY